MLPSAPPRLIIAERGQKTALSSDLRVQELVATVRGALIDLAWKAPDFDPATRQLVGFELFRDDTSTEPPSRLTSALMPKHILEARDLEVRPHSEYGVQPIWRIAEAGPPAVIAFGPPRLTKDLAGPGIFVPPEERIHSLAFLQRQGAITSEEMEQAVERFLGKAEPAPEAPPIRTAPAIGAGMAGASSSKARRLAFTYIAIAFVLVLILVGAGTLVGRNLFTQRPAATVVTSPSPAQPSPSGQPASSPTPTALPVNLGPVLISTADLRAGYVAGQSSSTALCPKCVPQLSSLSVGLADSTLKRNIVSAATVGTSSRYATAIAKALVAYLASRNVWTAVPGLGDQSYATTISSPGAGSLRVFYVVWRTGVITNEIMLRAPAGTLTMQNAIDLARVQQARAAIAHG